MADYNSDRTGSNIDAVLDKADNLTQAAVGVGGVVLIGKDASNVNTTGIELRDGDIWSTSSSTRASLLNRTGSDGTIQEFRKDGSVIGSIGVFSSSTSFCGKDAGLYFNGVNINPTTGNPTVRTDGVTSLGAPAQRFKDLYLSGGVYLGGTGASKINSNVDGTITYDADPNNTKPYTAHIWKLNGSESARIDSSGNLLVGTTSTSWLTSAGHRIFNNGSTTSTVTSGVVGSFNRLTSDGDIVQFRKDGTTSGSISVAGSTTSYNTSSDERLKENIQDTTHNVNINNIRVREFDWIEGGEHQRFGFIAQELETVYPEAVHSPEDADEMKSVDYSKLVPLLVKEIQQLKAEIKGLKA